MAKALSLETAVQAGKDFVDHVKGMTGGKAFLTGEYGDLYILDHLLGPHYGTEDPSPELKDFALSAGVYAALFLLKFWTKLGLEVFWKEAPIDECGVGVTLPLEGEETKTFFLACPMDLYGFVVAPPNPFPQFAESWITRRDGDPMLPRYVLGGLLLSQPLAKGDWPQLPPGKGTFMEDHLRRTMEELAASCARDLAPEDGLVRRVMEALYLCVLWPPVGAFSNDYGMENLRLIKQQVDFAGAENGEMVLDALEAMEKGWVGEGAFLGGVASKALRKRDDPPGEKLGFNLPEVRDILAAAAKLFADPKD